ncbi:protein neprosin-like [Cornus florida]|uniref:protein neprosin-like n=1 Tax=Cornus florida TaxID=4283 RepID=UPI0028A02729|nr:protein neprosin-like [Cornus florida]
MRPESSQPELIQLWHKNEQCPQGTIPIRRTPKHYNYHPNNPSLFHNKLVGAGNFTHEYAVADAVLDENCYGGQASVSVWNPKTELTEFSLSQIWVGSQSQQGSNTIEAGWTVNPRRYHDNMTRFFIYWTGDNYKSTGCYDLDCPGFVQTSRNFAIGSAIPGTSIYGGMPFDITITVYKDKKTGNWWLMVQNLVVGYWPASLFKGFADGASRLTWGGEIINRKSAGHHTTTEMGSGRFSSQGYERSSYFRNVKFIDSSNTLRDPVDLIQYVSNPQCYDLQFMNNTGFGISFFYGGPGYSARCP